MNENPGRNYLSLKAEIRPVSIDEHPENSVLFPHEG